jgi:chaperonin GroES
MQEQKSAGGSSFPTARRRSRRRAKVLAVGKGKTNDDGKTIPLDVKAGDRILFGKYSGSEIKVDGEECLILREDEVLGVSRAERRTAQWQPRSSSSVEDARRKMLRGINVLADAVTVDARAARPERRPREVVGRAERHEGRRHRREGDRVLGQVREHGRADGEGGRVEDVRRRR